MHRLNYFAFCLLFVLSSLIPEASACDYCGIYTVLSAHELTARSFDIGVSQALIGYGKMRKEGKATSDASGQNLKTNVTELDVEYDLTNHIGIEVAVPFVNHSYTGWDGEQFVDGSNSGLGEVAVYGFANPVQYFRGRTEFIWELFAGAKLPTGDSNKLKEELSAPQPGNVIRGRDIALGSGSADVPMGSAFLLNQDNVVIDGLVQYDLRTEGDYEYQYGNDLRWRASIGYQIRPSWGNITPGLLLSGFDKSADQLRGMDDPNSAQGIFLLGPSLKFDVAKKFNLYFEAQFPVYFQNDGIQPLQDHTVKLGLSVLL